MSTQNYAPLSQLNQQVQNDLNTGNYADAFALAQNQQVGMYGNKDQSVTDLAQDPGSLRNVNLPSGPQVNPDWAAAYGSDPSANLLNQLETPQGLQYLDPSKQWTQSDVNNYYTAAQKAAQGASGAPLGSAASQALGADPTSGLLWGDPSKFASDATTNWNTAPGAPNLAQFASAHPTQSFAEKYAIPIFDAAYLGLATAGIGSGVGAALGGGLGGAIGGGAAAGAAGVLGRDAMTGAPLTLSGLGEGILGGGLTGGLGYAAQPLSGALSDATGMSLPVATGLTKGAIGAGVGALGADLSGQNIGNAALAGGANGFASGLVGNATGNGMLGYGAGTIAGALASKYLGSSPSAPQPQIQQPQIPQQPMQAAPAAAAPTASTSPVAAAAPVAQPTPTPLPATATTNIGSYPTVTQNYQPRTPNNPVIGNYNTYGQGPEASFYTSGT